MSLQEGEQTLKDNVLDEYSEILRVYNYGDKKQAQKIYPKMDRTIKKASIGIQRHSMPFEGKEQVKWISDSYLMMGKAHFYKHDFISARRVFDYVAKNHTDDPIHYEAYLWLAKTHIGNERFEKAEATLNLLQSKMEEDAFPISVERQFPLVMADFYIAQEKYSTSYAYLERALELNNKKYIVTRAEFILGQINQMEGDQETATYYFNRVVKKNPDYKMAFEAKMNLAETYASESGNSKEINKILNKMLKEFRNKEFQDQIYYALAEVSKKDGDDTLAIHYLRKSVSVSVQNNVQKTKSSLEVADMFFERTNYVYAQAYYDTAVSSLPKDYPNYEAISRKAGILSNLVIQAQIIKEQDSLQTLARMDTTELYALIDMKIADYVEAEERKREEEEYNQGGTQFVDLNDRGKQNTNSIGGGWYFYNSAALSFGFSEFKKKWGNRKLEDNWRLTDKRMMMQSTEEGDIANENTSDSTSTTTGSTNPIDRSYYLGGIPNTPDKIEASNQQLIDAFNKLGFIYLMELNDTVKSEETYLEFQERFPENDFRLESWYALYKIYKGQNNSNEIEYYKNLILSNYPESTYAKVIINPDYYTLLEEEKLKASKLYMRTYNAFNEENYYRTISYSNRGIELYPEDTALMPRFLYLRALSLGKVDTPDTLYASLDSLIKTYPTSPVIPRAKLLKQKLQLEYGMGDPEELAELIEGEDYVKEEVSIYTYDENDVHFVMLVVNNKEVKVNPLKIRLSDFNIKYFSLMRLKTKSLMLDKVYTIITVGNFKNKDEAMNYFMAIKNDEYVLSGVDEKEYFTFPISTSNYPLFYRDKKIGAYESFFEKHYKRD
jgi:tetratricopeptide (TPR) repeat protein